MSVLSLFDDSYRVLLTNSISIPYLSRMGYAKRYGYMEDNVFPMLKEYNILEYDNARIIKTQTVDTVNNIWFIGYKDYTINLENFVNNVIKLAPDKVYIGKSITPTLVGECKYIDFTNIVFNTAHIVDFIRPKESYYNVINYFTNILSGIVEVAGNEEEFNTKYKDSYFFNTKIRNRLDYVRLASSYHFYTILHNKNIAKTVLDNIEYDVKKEENGIYDQTGLNLNEFELFVNKVKYYMGKM